MATYSIRIGDGRLSTKKLMHRPIASQPANGMVVKIVVFLHLSLNAENSQNNPNPRYRHITALSI